MTYDFFFWLHFRKVRRIQRFQQAREIDMFRTNLFVIFRSREEEIKSRAAARRETLLRGFVRLLDNNPLDRGQRTREDKYWQF